MTTEKIIMLVTTALLFALSLWIFTKSLKGKKKHYFISILGSSGLGFAALAAVLTAELFCGNLITLNICTVLTSLTLSVPGVTAMLFINLI